MDEPSEPGSTSASPPPGPEAEAEASESGDSDAPEEGSGRGLIDLRAGGWVLGVAFLLAAGAGFLRMSDFLVGQGDPYRLELEPCLIPRDQVVRGAAANAIPVLTDPGTFSVAESKTFKISRRGLLRRCRWPRGALCSHREDGARDHCLAE